MSRRLKRRPTDGELEILQVLWNLGPSTVRRVHETMGSTARLALHALSSARATAEELAEIRALLDRLEGSS
ncbi:MAG TPA: hypothetical protein EYO90_12095 [Candidatus Latescibacteria bacterium]|nr:hypothetical protein [Candidatus Latescibacterota bacterium]